MIFLFLPRLDNNRKKNPKKDMFLSSKTNVVRIHYLHAKRRERKEKKMMLFINNKSRL